MAGKPGWKHTPEARAKMAEAKRGKPRPDLAERNRGEAMRSRPRVISAAARERMAEERTTHGHARRRAEGRTSSRTYYVWAAMIQRCTNPNSKDWYLYGGRGIAVCERWRGSFASFLEDMGEKPDGLTLERIDTNGNYEPGNCKWATWLEQSANRRPYGSAKAIPA